MRNLSTLWTRRLRTGVPGTHVVSDVAIDPDAEEGDEGVYVVGESAGVGEQGTVDVGVWLLGGARVAQLSTTLVAGAPSVTVTAVVLPGEDMLVLALRNGDIVRIPLGPDDEDTATTTLTLAGQVLGAAASPTHTHLAVVLSGGTLVLLSLPELVPLPLSRDAAPAPVTAGWGSKATQFHGTAGKGAAAAEVGRGTMTPDDAGAGDVRIVWRGDGQFFAVGSVEGGSRALKVYSYAGALQSVAEHVPGLEAPLAWRPSGALLAGVQRFGRVPGAAEGEEGEGRYVLGAGRDDRHDVVFFERNGLRHGEFTLREAATATAAAAGRLRWGYRVRELLWNAESSVLAVWVERDGGRDVVQLWTTGNYHWYLKLELALDDDDARLTHVAWHPDDPARILLVGTRVVRVGEHVEHVSDITLVALTRYTAASPTLALNSAGSAMVCVVDGDTLLLTPFQFQNVPPPMAAHVLALPRETPPQGSGTVPLHVALCPAPTLAQDILAVLLPHNRVVLYALPVGPMRDRGPAPRVLWQDEGHPAPSAEHTKPLPARQISLHILPDGTIFLALLCTNKECDVMCGIVLDAIDAERVEVRTRWTIEMHGAGRGRMLDSAGVGVEEGLAFAYQDCEGVVFGVVFSTHTPGLAPTQHRIATFPTFCTHALLLPPPSASPSSPNNTSFSTPAPAPLCIGLASTGTLYATLISLPSPPSSTPPSPVPVHTLTHACTSLARAGALLVCTRSAPAHEVLVWDLFAQGGHGVQNGHQNHDVQHQHAPPSTPHGTPTERGAVITTVTPGAGGVVLQTPRGSLETMFPRALVMRRIRGEMGRRDFRAAFLTARKHRVDLDVLVPADFDLDGDTITNANPNKHDTNTDSNTPDTDTDKAQLRKADTDVARFAAEIVEQVHEASYLELLLAGIGRSARPAQHTARLCDALRAEMERRDVRRYLTAILTAHVVKTPADYEGALGVLLTLRETDPTLVEDAVKYVIFLVDADRLFDTALGMYDFALVLLVAQHSQKDPREYLPFLRTLRAHEGPYQRFAIDDHLRRHAKALRSLHDAGAAHFAEALTYVARHGLYADALGMWRSGDDRAAMLEVYGDYLFERREFAQAALAFVSGGRTRKALVAYERALDWQALFDTALREGLSADDRLAMARRVAEDLGTKRRHADAARVLLDYADDVDAAVAALVRAGEWAEARRITTFRERTDLVDSVVIPGALEARESLSEEIREVEELRGKQVARLDELAAKKVEDPDVFYGVEDGGGVLANVDVMTDVSNPGTMYTRYTAAPSASSNRSKRTSRSKRKLDRKAGRKGTVEEEEYLLRSITKLIARLDAVLVEASALLPQLLMLSEELAAEGRALQEEVEALESALRRDVTRVWDERSVPPPPPSPSPHGRPTGPLPPAENLAEKVPRPVISEVQWRISWV